MDYSFYLDEFGGDKITEAQFESRLDRAEWVLDKYTYGRYLKHRAAMASDGDMRYRVNMALCSIMDMGMAQAARQGIASENNDGYSVSYTGSDAEDIRSVVQDYLGNSFLTNRRV